MERDLSALPESVRASARVHHNGEVSWPDDRASEAIEALAAANCVVLGLDVRFYDQDGRFYEIAWSSFEPDGSKSETENGEEARQEAQQALARIDELDVPEDTVERYVLITWQ